MDPPNVFDAYYALISCYRKLYNTLRRASFSINHYSISIHFVPSFFEWAVGNLYADSVHII